MTLNLLNSRDVVFLGIVFVGLLYCYTYRTKSHDD